MDLKLFSQKKKLKSFLSTLGDGGAGAVFDQDNGGGRCGARRGWGKRKTYLVIRDRMSFVVVFLFSVCFCFYFFCCLVPQRGESLHKKLTCAKQPELLTDLK